MLTMIFVCVILVGNGSSIHLKSDDVIHIPTSIDGNLDVFEGIRDHHHYDRAHILRRMSLPKENNPSILLIVDPPNGTVSMTSLGVYLWASNPNAQIYYTLNGSEPSLYGLSINRTNPYIQLDCASTTPIQTYLRAIALAYNSDTSYWYSSNEIFVQYMIESDQRPYSYGFFVPGVESNGIFLRLGLEMKALPRAQFFGGQEYADFKTFDGVGTYAGQILTIPLLSFDDDLTGFEGGFSASVRNSDGTYQRYGFLVPNYNGQKYFGKVVRIDLHFMGLNHSQCMASNRTEIYNPATKSVQIIGSTSTSACVVILDLASMNRKAVGFRKGFTGKFPDAYLVPGTHDVVVKINIAVFSLATTRFLDMGSIDTTLGGYSGGFMDGVWACFSPFKSYVGPVGGIRSRLPVDANQLRTYRHGAIACVNTSDPGWEYPNMVSAATILKIELENLDHDLRGFSDAIRVGRYAYLCPFATFEHIYSSKVVRVYLGPYSIFQMLQELDSTGKTLRDIVDVLDLSQSNTTLRGFSGMFTAGRYIYFVPYRNAYEPDNGQRGFGTVARLDMNVFDISGVSFVDMPSSRRAQFPNFPDDGLRGFSAGFASGKYGVLVPFFNGLSSGKSGRFNLMNLHSDVQMVDLTKDRVSADLYKGYRGAFTSPWTGLIPDQLGL